MGNQALNHDLRNVQDLDFDPKKLDPFLSKLWTFEELDSIRYKHIGSGIVSIDDDTLEKQFPTQCTIE